MHEKNSPENGFTYHANPPILGAVATNALGVDRTRSSVRLHAASSHIRTFREQPHVAMPGRTHGIVLAERLEWRVPAGMDIMASNEGQSRRATAFRVRAGTNILTARAAVAVSLPAAWATTQPLLPQTRGYRLMGVTAGKYRMQCLPITW